jgi:hypothetical protein
MNWLKKIVIKWVKEDWDESSNKLGSGLKIRPAPNVTMDIDDYPESVRFDLSPAVGGRILTIRRYDRQRDRSENTVYVIPAGEDVGARVAKIVNLELLK